MPADLRSETLIPERGVQRIADATEAGSPQGVTVMNTCHLYPLSVIAAAGLTLTPVARICADPVAQVRVTVADVNLSYPQGIATVYARLRRAAGDVCGSEPQYRELGRHAAWSKCVRAALDGAVVQVHSIGLAELHAKHFGGGSLLLAARGTPEDR
jgi:UrcA family protein